MLLLFGWRLAGLPTSFWYVHASIVVRQHSSQHTARAKRQQPAQQRASRFVYYVFIGCSRRSRVCIAGATPRSYAREQACARAPSESLKLGFIVFENSERARQRAYIFSLFSGFNSVNRLRLHASPRLHVQPTRARAWLCVVSVADCAIFPKYAFIYAIYMYESVCIRNKQCFLMELGFSWRTGALCQPACGRFMRYAQRARCF